MQIFTIAPLEGWQAGDRVYCTKGIRGTVLETGKTYTISTAQEYRGLVEWALTLDGVSLPHNCTGFSSRRFVKLRAGRKSLDEIDLFTTPVWLDAYRASVGQAAHPDHELRGRT